MSTSPIKLRISRQDLDYFPHFELTAEGAQYWVQELPVTNAKLVVEQLCKVTADLNRTPMAADVRYQILETLRPTQQVALATLKKRFLKQPVVLPKGAKQMADMAFNLLRFTVMAYTTVAIEGIKTASKIESMPAARLVCSALHRAITAASRKLLHTFQLYQPVELHGWLEINQLYALAERQKLESHTIEDDIFGSGTITNTYVRALLLACCKPNQLRQHDMSAVFRALREWAPLCTLTKNTDSQGLFLINLGSDRPPIYSALRTGQVSMDERHLDTGALIDTVSELQRKDIAAGGDGIVFDTDTVLSPGMLRHLIGALGMMSQRNFARTPANEQLNIAIGLSSAHHQLLNGDSFSYLVSGNLETPEEPGDDDRTNPFMEESATKVNRDPWDETGEQLDKGKKEEEHNLDTEIQLEADYLNLIKPAADSLTDEQRYPIFPVNIVNASPGGYCLRWAVELPGEISAGDLVCLRDGPKKPWVIAAIRWVSTQNNQDALVGVELLSPRAVPYAARTHRKTGPDGELMRVLLLPEIKLVGQGDTLITPRAGFREGYKVSLVRNGEERFVQLGRQVNATAAFSQFDFRPIKHLEEVATDSGTPIDTEYESVWTQI